MVPYREECPSREETLSHRSVAHLDLSITNLFGNCVSNLMILFGLSLGMVRTLSMCLDHSMTEYKHNVSCDLCLLSLGQCALCVYFNRYMCRTERFMFDK